MEPGIDMWMEGEELIVSQANYVAAVVEKFGADIKPKVSLDESHFTLDYLLEDCDENIAAQILQILYEQIKIQFLSNGWT